MPDQITIGPFTFEYAANHSEMYVIKGEEAAAMVEVWDDRAVTVEANPGRPLAPSSRGLS